MMLDEFTTRAIRVPFVEQGRGWSGWDCWGAVVLFYHEVLGIDLPSYVADQSDIGGACRPGQPPKWDSVERPEPGDVVLLSIAGRPVHVGLAIGAGLMLHTEPRIGTLIERLASPKWNRRVEGFYRYVQ